jgi:hypothetical protein
MEKMNDQPDIKSANEKSIQSITTGQAIVPLDYAGNVTLDERTAARPIVAAAIVFSPIIVAVILLICYVVFNK